MKYLCCMNKTMQCFCLMAYFSLSSSGDPLSGNIEEMASKIFSDGNFLGKSPRPESNNTTPHTSLGASANLVSKNTDSTSLPLYFLVISFASEYKEYAPKFSLLRDRKSVYICHTRHQTDATICLHCG